MAAVKEIHLPTPHEAQSAFIFSPAKRKIVRAGRRGGKTVGVAILSVLQFLRGGRVLYAAPTNDQLERYWYEVTMALGGPVADGMFKKNETFHTITRPGTNQRIRAKTAFNANTLRGDFADLLILDEWQLMDEHAWALVGAPMLLDNNGDAVFIYTPPSASSSGVSKARDKMHAAKMFKEAALDTTGRWDTFHFSSFENPFLDPKGLVEIAQDMTALAYRQEIGAEDIDELPGALWTRKLLEDTRRREAPSLSRIVIAIDPATTSKSTSNETGIVVVGLDENNHGFVLEDLTLRGGPDDWGSTAVAAYDRYRADRIVAEVNNGGDMVEYVVRSVASNMFEQGRRESAEVSYKKVSATKGKYIRAEPIAALYEHGKVHHVGSWEALEDQLVGWLPGDPSPDRLDALVWGLTELMLSLAPPLPDDILSLVKESSWGL
jgi:hypothetical protein